MGEGNLLVLKFISIFLCHFSQCKPQLKVIWVIHPQSSHVALVAESLDLIPFFFHGIVQPYSP